MTSQEGTDSSSCILKKARCCSLGEDVTTRQAAKEKHRKEKELTYTKSLRKRRSFLKTDYTSQVTFPLVLPGSLQSCCSWPPPLPVLAQPPAPPSSENFKKGAEIVLLAATQAQRDTAVTNPSSDLMEMEPDTMENKSVTNSVVSYISAVHLLGDQHREENAGNSMDGGLQPVNAVHSPFWSLEEALPLPGGESRATQESSSMKINTVCLTEERSVGSGGWLAQAALEEVGEVMAGQHTAGDVPPFPSQEVTCPANKHKLPLSAHDPSEVSPHAVAQKQELLPAAGRQAACEESVLPPCEERKTNHDRCAENHDDSALSQAESREVTNKDALWKAHSKNATQLLTDCSSTSGIITRLSWLSLGVRTELTSHSPSEERVDSPPELLASQKTTEYPGANAVRMEMQTSPAGPSFEEEMISSQELDEGEPRHDAGNVALKQPRPIQTLLPREQAIEVGKDFPLTPSVGLSFSGPILSGSLWKTAGDQGASKHSFLCFNHKKDEQTPSDPIMTRSLDFSTMKKSPPQLGMDKCSCQLSYISCFHRPDDKGGCETIIPMCSTFLTPLTTPPSSSHSLPGTPVGSYPVFIASDVAWQNPDIRALRQLKDEAQMSPADFSCFLAYTTELREVVGKLSNNQATHLQEKCTEQGAESKGVLHLVSRDLLSSCQELLKTAQPLKELQGVLRVTFNHLVRLVMACFQVTHCQLCRQRQQELEASLVDVVATYHQLLQAVHQQLCRQSCPDLGAKLLTRQHTALKAAMFCLLQQFRLPPLL